MSALAGGEAANPELTNLLTLIEESRTDMIRTYCGLVDALDKWEERIVVLGVYGDSLKALMEEPAAAYDEDTGEV